MPHGYIVSAHHVASGIGLVNAVVVVVVAAVAAAVAAADAAVAAGDADVGWTAAVADGMNVIDNCPE